MADIKAEIINPTESKLFCKVGITGWRSQNVINCFDIEEGKEICKRINTDVEKVVRGLKKEYEDKKYDTASDYLQTAYYERIVALEAVLKRLSSEGR